MFIDPVKLAQVRVETAYAVALTMGKAVPTDRRLPPNGAVIVFDRAPAGSYASEGTEYLVEYVHGAKGRLHDVHLINVATGAGTYDRPAMVERSAWRAVA